MRILKIIFAMGAVVFLNGCETLSSSSTYYGDARPVTTRYYASEQRYVYPYQHRQYKYYQYQSAYPNGTYYYEYDYSPQVDPFTYQYQYRSPDRTTRYYMYDHN